MRRRAPIARALLAAVAVAAVVLGTIGATAGPAVAGKLPSGAGALHSLRSPVTDENFYFVMADRFENGDAGNDTGDIPGDRLQHGFDPTARGFYNGGDLAGLLDRIDYIEGLGTTSIWLTPSFKNKAVQLEDGPSAGYHGYWITDFTQIDPHLGTNAELEALVDAAHHRGMKVYFDIITNHTADVIGYEEGARTAYVPKDVEPYRTASGTPFDDRDHAGGSTFPPLSPTVSFPYTPVLDPAEQSLKVPDWLNDVTLYHNRGNTTFTGEDSYYGDFFGLDDLFTEHPAVVDGMIEIYKKWIGDFGVDGFRIDTMKHVNDEFWQEFGPEVLDYAHSVGKDEFFMFGEVFDTTKSFTSHFTTTDRMQAVLDFPFQEAARNFASRGQSADHLRSFFLGDDWYTDADSNVYQLPTFLGNHDMGRIGHFVSSDNAGASDDELVARDRLAHELMYFSRGNPVVYYGDEQGFTGTGGDQVARQTLFASQVPEYLDDDLLGTDRTHAQDNFEPSHPMYQAIRDLADVTTAHTALRDGAHQHRYADGGAGVYSFSRIDREEQREYVVALNNSETARTVAVPTYLRRTTFGKVYGSGESALTTGANRRLPVTVPALSAVVYRASRDVPSSGRAPEVELDRPQPAAQSRGRMQVTAEVDGRSFYEVTFHARVGDGPWQPVGTDDNAPYSVFHDVSGEDPGTPVRYRAVALDNAGHTSTSRARSTRVPLPAVAITTPQDGGEVTRLADVTVAASVAPDRASNVVELQRSVAGGAWTSLGTDDSSPVYTAFDDVSALELGTQVRYRAVLTMAGGTTVTSSPAGVTVAPPRPLVGSVTVAGSLQSELGCPGDWDPGCAATHLTFDDSDGRWKGTFAVPAGGHQWKVAIDDSWAENYGAGGARDGGNIALTLAADSTVTFVWDQNSKVPSATVG
ncbi:MAG: alpha-amylase family glycosyl hydrolase [Actinomycetes bacterium]